MSRALSDAALAVANDMLHRALAEVLRQRDFDARGRALAGLTGAVTGQYAALFGQAETVRFLDQQMDVVLGLPAPRPQPPSQGA